MTDADRPEAALAATPQDPPLDGGFLDDPVSAPAWADLAGSEPAEAENLADAEPVVDDFFSDEEFDLEPTPTDPHLDRTVVAVLVLHDGLPWLPVTLAALRSQERPPDRLIAVDTGSTDASLESVRQFVAADDIVTMPRTTSFADAVAAGVARGGATDWIWVLHDDCAPRADALLHLIDTAESSNGAAIVGPKVLGWADRSHLLEIGITIGRGGRRETGLERGERDQGQHDRDRDVLAVGSAGMLVRAAVWHELGGFDPAFAMFRDDIDFGWRANSAGHRVIVAANAVVHHAEAATHVRRAADAVDRHPRRADRLNAMRVVLGNCSTLALPFLLIGFVLGSLLRSIGYLVGKDVTAARDEAIALGQLLLHPGLLRSMRSRRASTRSVRPREVSSLLASPGAQVRQAAETLSGVLNSSGAEPARLGGSLESGPSDDDSIAGLVDSGPGIVGRTLRRPGVWGTLVLLALTLVAMRGLYGSGRLLGGALLPAPGGASDWWSAFGATWHPVSIGSSLAQPPSLVVLGTVAIPLLGSASAVIDLLVLLAVPLSFVSAYAALRGVLRSVTLRMWAAATYALLPAVTIATSSGRIGTLVLAILLPVLARAATHLMGAGLHPAGPRAAWGVGLLLAVIGAFVPMMWVFCVVLAVVASLTRVKDGAGRLRLLVACAVPLVVWLPWTFELVRHPQWLLLEAGLPAPGLADSALPAWSLLGLNPGGISAPWWLLTVGVILAAITALLRRGRRQLITTLWVIGGVALTAALVLTWVTVNPPNSAPVAAWPGPMLVVAAAALLTAAAVGSEGALRRLSVTGFSFRQVLAAVVAAVALLAPVTSAAVWVSGGAADPIEKADPVLLPAFVALQSQGAAQPRTLVLQVSADRVSYALVRSVGPRLGDAEVAPLISNLAGLDGVVSDLAAGRGGVEAARLSQYAARFVLVNAPVPADLAQRLDSAPGLTRVGAPDGGALWQVAGVSARARFVPTTGAVSVLASGPIEATGPVPKNWAGGRIVLADSADGGWRASVGGRPLKSVVVNGWAQGFELPAKSSGAVEVTYVSSLRTVWLTVAGLALVVVAVLALPARRREGEGEDA